MARGQLLGLVVGLLGALAPSLPAKQAPAEVRVVPPAQPEHVTGSWFEEVLLRSGSAGQSLEAPEIAAILDARGGPELALLRLRLGAVAEPTQEDREAIYRALQEEHLARFREQVARLGVPSDATPGQEVAWKLLAGDEAGALEFAGALAETDTTIDARVARSWAALADGGEYNDQVWLSTALDLDACRGEARGVTTTLVVFADRPLEAATALDGEALQALLAEALALAPSTDDPALSLLERAGSANVLDPRPHVAAAKRLLGRTRYEEALVAIDSALRRDPLDDNAWAIRAIASRGCGDERGALLAAERALELRPGDPSHEERYVGSLVRLGLLREAAAFVGDIVAYPPDQPWSAIAFALDRNLTFTSMFQDILFAALEEQLSDEDLETRLWAATALCVARRDVVGEARVLLEGLVQFHGDESLGRAAAALLDENAAGTPFWSGLAQQIRKHDWEARTLWRTDALGRGVDAQRARGLLTYLGDTDSTTPTSEEASAGTPPVPTWAELPAEPVPLLPDPSACAVRVPEEAATIEQALGLLPEGASRIVLGRGTFLTPASISRSVTLVGAGTHWQTGTELGSGEGWFGDCVVATSSECTAQLVDLRIALRLKAAAGALAIRRCRFLTSMHLGGGLSATLPLTVEFDHVQSDVAILVSHKGGRVLLRDCVGAVARDLKSSNVLSAVSGTVDRCIFLASQGREALTASSAADIQVNDCVFMGTPAKDGTPTPAVGTYNDGRATVRGALAFDLDPCDNPLVTVTNSRMRRTASTTEDTLGWTVFGASVELLDAEAPVVRVPEDEPSLDAAIARAAPGATIQLGAGTYELGTTIQHALHIVGAGPSKTTLRLASSNRTLNVSTRLELERLLLSDSNYNPNGGITQSELFATPAAAPALVLASGGDLRFGADVHFAGALGLRMTASGGGVVHGTVAKWDAIGKVVLEAYDDSAIVLGEQPWKTGYARAGSLAVHPLRLAVLRPPLLALAPRPEASEARLVAERLARVDSYLALIADSATGAQLADIANRLWCLLPKETRTEEILRRITPRFKALARSNARVGVEEVISFVFSDFGPGPSDEQAFDVLVGVARALRSACPPDTLVYVDARMSGMGQAQADDAARSALLMEALGAGRIDQALALASKLGDAARARVLVVHEPTSLSYEQLLTLRDAAGLDAVTAQRIKILISALFRSRAPMRPSPPSGVGAMMRYFDAKNTGKPNEFYDVIRVVDPTGEVLYYKAVERPAPAFAEDKPRPAAPPSGSSESAWSAYYSALESW